MDFGATEKYVNAKGKDRQAGGGEKRFVHNRPFPYGCVCFAHGLETINTLAYGCDSMTQDTKSRLTREDWILAGFRALSRSGSSALKAEALARELKTTKGSFYWHFKDVADFESAMLAYWRAQATEEVIASVAQSSGAPEDDLRSLLTIVTGLRSEAHGGLRAESAIRQWASTNHRVADARHAVDAARLDYLGSLFIRAGFSQERAKLFSQAMYAALIGLEYLELQQLGNVREGLTGLLETLLSSEKNR
jgi:AcrR family transcriptional regulator